MNKFTLTIIGLFLFSGTVFAHGAEEAEQLENLADADWSSPVIAVVIIVIAIVIARIIKKNN